MAFDADRVTMSLVGAAPQRAEEPEADQSRFAERFSRFIREFNVQNVFVYRERLRKHFNLKERILEVDLADLRGFDEDLAADLEKMPNQAVRELRVGRPRDQPAPEIQVTIHFGGEPMPLRRLVGNSENVSRLAVIAGICTSTSEHRAVALAVAFECRKCHDQQMMDIRGRPGFDNPPVCKVGGKDCGVRPYVLVPDRCLFRNQQTIKVQESPESVPTGEMPRSLQVVVDRGLCGRAVPGARIRVVGTYAVWAGNRSDRSAVRQPYLRAVGLNIDDHGSGRVSAQFTPDEEEAFTVLSQDPDLYGQLADSIAPVIYGHHDIKRALVCQLFGGTRKQLPDSARLRGDINVLLIGDPGTAKSQMLKFIEQIAPVGVYTSGKGSSAAGLTASVIRDPASRDFYLEGGAMVLADGGIVCIDEFDKMHPQDRVAIHEAMEQQTISVAKAGITTMLNTRTAVLAAANPVFGHYDSARSSEDNIDFQTTILSRFDCIFLVKDSREVDKDKTMTRHVLAIHSGQRVEADGAVPLALFKRYVSYCRAKCQPRLSDQGREMLLNHFVNIRAQMRARRVGGDRSRIPITIRQLEAIVRLSEALAKMTLSAEVHDSHVEEAIRLFNVSTVQAMSSNLLPTDQLTPEAMAEVNTCEKLLLERLPIGSHISEKAVVEDFRRQGIDEFSVRKAIEIMVRRDQLEYRAQRKNIYRRR